MTDAAKAEKTTTPGAVDQHGTQIFVGHSNTFHDTAVAVMAGDEVYAEALERHLQCKRSMGSAAFYYSYDIIQSALTRLKILPFDSATVTYRSTWGEKGLTGFEKRRLDQDGSAAVPGVGELTQALVYATIRLRPLHERQLEWILRGVGVQSIRTVAETFPESVESKRKVDWKTEVTDHHVAHIGNAVYTSPFDECVVMISDGVANGPALSFHHFKDNEIHDLPAEPGLSMGLLYIRITMLCGFDPTEGEEWKVMGLAAYGKPDARIRRVLDETFTVRGLSLCLTKPDEPPFEWMKRLEEAAGGFRTPDEDPRRAADLAHNYQAFHDDVTVQLLQNAFKLGLSKNLVVAGGCALNSSTNGKIIGRTGFERLHVPCAPADDGNALGAVLYEKHYVRKVPRKLEAMTPYLGSWIDLPNLERVLSFKGIDYWEAPNDDALCTRVAQLLADGGIIAWVQGRAEFGPRALGNRSILADPRPVTMKDEINRRVKFREQYRPVAPSILHEHGPEYFENYQESPYMERTLSFREEVRERVPAVVHIDGTGRLQSVKKELNPLFHKLITAFKNITGVPILLNTSFNVMGKPIVHSVTDALAVFYSTDLDYLIVENYVLSKRGGSLKGG